MEIRTHNHDLPDGQPVQWMLSTLGQLKLIGAPEPPAIMSHAAWSVLAYMACAPQRQPIPRERIQHDVFDEVNQPAHMLRNAIYVLRRWLGDAVVVTRSHVAFAPWVVIVVDATTFLAETSHDATFAMRMRAVARYHGVFLVKPQYGWARDMAHHLYERYITTLLTLLDLDASQGRAHWLLLYAQRYVHEHEWDAVAHERLIRVLLANGHRMHAYAQIAHARRVIDPMPHDWLERMERVVAQAHQHTPVDPISLSIERVMHVAQVPLSSRIEYIDALSVAWQAHLRGWPQFVVIHGESGSGKTHLLNAFARQQVHTRIVWFGRAIGSVAEDTFYNRLQLVVDHDAQLRDYVMQVYAQLPLGQQPNVATHTPSIALSSDAHMPYAQRNDALMRGFVRFVADQPLVLIVDDGSSELIHELHEVARQIPQMMVIVTSEEQVVVAATRHLHITALPNDEVAQLVRAVFLADVPALLDDIVQTSNRTMHQVRTMLRQVLDSGQLTWNHADECWRYVPQSLSVPLLPALSAAAMQLLQLIAIIDGGVAIDAIVARPLGYRHRIRNLIAQLVEHQLVECRGDYVRIAHASLSQRLLTPLTLDQRIQLHRWAMQSTTGITKASHAMQAGEMAIAQSLLHDIADSAWRDGDVYLLRQVYGMIQKLPQSLPDVQWLMAVNTVRMGRFGAEPTDVRNAVASLSQLSTPSSQRHHEALISAGISLRWAGYPRESIDILRRVYDDAVYRKLPRLIFAAAHALTFAYIDHGQVSQSLVMHDAIHAPRTQIVSQVVIALTQSYVYARIGDFARAERSFDSIARYKVVMNARTQALIEFHAGVISLAKCDHVATQRQLSAVYQTMFDVGDMVTNLMAGAIMCMDYVRFGRYVEAEHLVHTVLERSTSLQLLRQRLMALFGYLHILVHQHKWAEAKQLAEHGLDEAQAAGLLEYEAALAAFLLRATSVLNERSQQVLTRCIEVHARLDDPYAFGWYHELAWFYWEEGNQSEALRWALIAESKAHQYTTAAILPVTIIAIVALILQGCQHRQYLTTRSRGVDLMIGHLRNLPSATARIDFVRNNRGLSALMDVPSLTTGDVVVWLPADDAPRGRRLRDDERIPVIWPGTVLRNHERSLTDKIKALADHAKAQGATVMIRDLAKVLFVHERTVLRAVAQAAEHGITIRTYRPRRASP